MVAWAKESLGQVFDPWRPPSGVRVRVTDDVLSDIVSTSVLILINTYYKADPLTSKPGPTGYIVQLRRSYHEIIGQLWPVPSIYG